MLYTTAIFLAYFPLVLQTCPRTISVPGGPRGPKTTTTKQPFSDLVKKSVFWLANTTASSFSEADAQCRRMNNSRLASLESGGYSQIQANLVHHDMYWVGLKAFHDPYKFNWIDDGTSLDQTTLNWAPGHPNGANLCAAIDPETELVISTPCCRLLPGRDDRITICQETNASFSFRVVYTDYFGWSDAKKSCEDSSLMLPHPRSRADILRLLRMRAGDPYVWLWLGLRVDQKWQWLSGFYETRGASEGISFRMYNDCRYADCAILLQRQASGVIVSSACDISGGIVVDSFATPICESISYAKPGFDVKIESL